MLKPSLTNNTHLIGVIADVAALKPIAFKLAEQLQLPYLEVANPDFSYLLAVTACQLELRKTTGNEKPLIIDFLSGAATHRRLQGGGAGQLIAKAVGMKKQYRPNVLDVSAGLGRDAFVLACLGCKVLMLERSPVLACLLEDGLKRLFRHEEFKQLSLSLIAAESFAYLENLDPRFCPEVIYLDPMFPERHKTALVKKEMRILRDIVGDDLDAPELLAMALQRAKKRVVVKRSKLALPLSAREPDLIYSGKTSRFDVYLLTDGRK